MADKMNQTRERKKATDDDDFFQIRAKGQYLRVPKELEEDDVNVPSGADHLIKKTKRKKKVLSRIVKRKNVRNGKKAKKNEFFHKRAKLQGTVSSKEFADSPKKEKDTSKPKTKKKKRKRKNSEPSERELEIERLKQENEKEDKEIKKLEKLLNMNKKKKLPSQFVADGLDYLLEVCDHERFNIASKSDSETEDEEVLDKYTKAFSRNNKEKKRDKEDRKNPGVKERDMDDDDGEMVSDQGESFDESDGSINHKDDADDNNDNMDDAEIGGNIDVDHDGDDDDDDSNGNVDDVEIVNKIDDEHDDSDDDHFGADDVKEDDDDDEEGLSDDDDDEGPDIPCKKPKREEQNIKDQSNNTTKYIPPHLRNNDSSDANKEHLVRIKRQLKGLFNKLSEGNLQFVCNEMEELFAHNSRNDMNELLTKVILDSCVSPSIMPSKLLMEHCLLLAVLTSNIGMEIGAYFTQTLALQFDSLHKDNKGEDDGKKIFNVVLLFAHLYNFKVIHCGLIYDIIRHLAEGFQERDIDLLLLILKSTGAEIRRDDPGSLKDIILELQAKAASASDLSNDSRVRFMLEIIANLRNNNLRKIPGYDPSQVEHLRKLLRSVIRNTGGTSSSQLQISLKDLLQADTKGRWWIVGSAWSGRNENKAALTTSSRQWNSQLLELAHKQRMNTDIRRNVFCVMMTSEDYVDAFEKLLRLKLKDVQAREIVHVLLDCCLKEKAYNPFYAYLGQKFCEYNRSYQVTFQFSFWDKLKVIDSLKTNSVNNMSLLLIHLIASKALSLSVLKAVNFMDVDKPSIHFFQHLFTHLLTDYPADIVTQSFERIASIPDLSHLRQGIAIFIRHFMLKKKKHDADRANSERIQSVLDILQTRKDLRL